VTNASHIKKEGRAAYSARRREPQLRHPEPKAGEYRTRTTAAASTVGSAEGNVASRRQRVPPVASDVVAPRANIDITARSVDILEGQNTGILTQKAEFRQSGLTLASAVQC